MKLMNTKNKIGGAILTLSLLFGIGMASSLKAQAQYRNDGQWQRDDNDGQWQRDRNNRRDRDDDYRNDQYNRNNRNNGYNNNRVALNQGYQAGLNTGASDAQRGQNYSPQRSRYYRSGNSQAFRQGFVQGYDAGYRQYSNNRGYNQNRTGNILGQIFGRGY
jgi:hypothetical protein